MFAPIVGAVVRGIVVDDFDVADQPGPRVCAFDQVMAEQGIARKAVLEYAAQGLDFVDSLAGEYAFALQVLVDVGGRTRVDVESGLAGIDTGQARLRGALHADADPRLQNAVSRNYDVVVRIDDGLVQRMSHRAHQPMRRAARQFRIAVERQHKANMREQGEIANLHREAVVLAINQAIEVEQLAALALPAHPDAFARVVDAVPMKKRKRPLARLGILLIELANQSAAELDQRIVFVRRLRRVRHVASAARNADCGLALPR